MLLAFSPLRVNSKWLENVIESDICVTEIELIVVLQYMLEVSVSLSGDTHVLLLDGDLN